MRLYYTEVNREFEVLRWHGDVGAISVRQGKDPWMTVLACDPHWIGKSDIDLDVWLAERGKQDQDEAQARRNFINAANTESYRLKQLAGLISLPRTSEELERDITRFSRHTDTAERRLEYGEYRPLLADLDETYASVQPQAAKTPPSFTNEKEAGGAIIDQDLME